MAEPSFCETLVEVEEVWS